jgi:hypothetical protein
LQKVWSNLVSALSAAGAGTWRVVNVTEVTFGSSAAGNSNGSRSLPDDATIVSKNTATRRLQADLAGPGDNSGTAAASSQTCSAEDAAGGSCEAGDNGQQAWLFTEGGSEDAAGQVGQCSAEEFLGTGHQQPGEASRTGPTTFPGTSKQRRRLTQAVSDNSTTVLVRIVPADREDGSLATLPLALTSLSGPVAAAVQQQSGAQQVADQPPQPYGVLSVQMMERMGVCGNGVCEVGERPWVDAQGSIVQPATAACPQVRTVDGMHCLQPAARWPTASKSTCSTFHQHWSACLALLPSLSLLEFTKQLAAHSTRLPVQQGLTRKAVCT